MPKDVSYEWIAYSLHKGERIAFIESSTESEQDLIVMLKASEVYGQFEIVKVVNIDF